MAVPEVHLEARDEGPNDEAIVVLVCECGWKDDLPFLVSLGDVINRVAEHNYERHLRPDNTGLRIGRR